MDSLTNTEIKFLNSIILDKQISDTKSQQVFKRIKRGEITPRQYLLELFLSSGFGKVAAEKATEFHLYYIHHARIQLVSTMLPPASIILDLGGANGSIVDMGYPHAFEKITVVDLLPEDRVEMYKKLKIKKTRSSTGTIEVHYGDMSDLSFTQDNSVDLVWSGESIEHIPEDAADRMIKEAFRVLKPGGYFCLDTPNRFLTEIHTKGLEFPFIHPEHKIEYYPKQLKQKLKKGGFRIVESKGVKEMVNTYKSGEIDYTDFVKGKPLSDSLDMSYMQYYKCQKPYPFARNLDAHAYSKKLKQNVKHAKSKLARK